VISIVDELRSWTKNNSAKLRENHIQLIEKIPEPGSNLPWKASVGLIHNGIVVSYTVWERTRLQTQLIVFNATTKKTIDVNDSEPQDAHVVWVDLDGVVKRLLDGSYKRMNPDPKLVIT
jgi:hypothetical protein